MFILTKFSNVYSKIKLYFSMKFKNEAISDKCSNELHRNAFKLSHQIPLKTPCKNEKQKQHHFTSS